MPTPEEIAKIKSALRKLLNIPEGVPMMLTEQLIPQQCDQCSAIGELRPYGPNGSLICFECGMKDEEGTSVRFGARLDEGRDV